MQLASMADIRSATAEIRRERKKKKKKKKKKRQDENIIVCPIPQGDHNKRQFTTFQIKLHLINRSLVPTTLHL